MKPLLFLFALCPLLLFGQTDRVKNDPTHDDKWLHFGFSVGLNAMDFNVRNSQAAIDSGVYTEVSTLRPGFHVHAISNLRMGKFFDLRFTPGIAFGGIRELTYTFPAGQLTSIDPADLPVKVESNFLEFPLLLKYKSVRLNNFRPYLVGGANTRVDLAAAKKTWGRSRKENNLVLLKPLDLYYEIGVGLDFYLQYFKFAVELKYSVGVVNVLRTSYSKRGETIYPPADDAVFTDMIDKLNSRMFLISFHFE